MIKAIFSSKSNILLTLLLLVSCAYATIQASYIISNNSDVFASTFMLVDAPVNDALHYQYQHTNLFKIPMLWLQAQFDYTYKSFVLLNGFVLAATVFGWLWMMITVTKAAYFKSYALGLSFLFLASPYFAPQLAFSTIRNIEFPLSFLMVFIIGQLIFRSRLWLAGAASVVFAFLLASDNLVFYTLLPTIAITLAIMFLRTTKNQRAERLKIYQAFGCLALMAIATKLIIAIVVKFNILHLTSAGETPKIIVALSDLPVALLTTLQHMFTAFGAHIFGNEVDSYAILGLGLVVSVLVCVLLVLTAKLFKGWFNQLDSVQTFTAFTMLLWGLVLVVFYILLDLWKDFNNVRYVSIVPLLALFAAPYLSGSLSRSVQKLTFIAKEHRQLLLRNWAKLTVAAFILISVGGMTVTHRTYAQQKRDVAATHGYYDRINELANRYDAHVGVAGYWDSIRTRFWTHNNVLLAPIGSCNQALPYLTNDAWYEAKGNAHSMLVMDFTGDDAPNWKCSEDELTSMYGDPQEKISVTGLRGTNAEVWIYNYDIRSRVDLSKYHQ